MQSWAQRKRSRLNFGRVAARTWDEHTNALGAEPEVRADVFVFAVQTSKDPARYDALDIAQWEFYVVPARHVRECGYKSVSMAWVRSHAEAVELGEVAAAVNVPAGDEPRAG